MPMMPPRPARFEDRLRAQLALHGLGPKCRVFASRDGVVGCVAPSDLLSEDECARLLTAWTSTVTRVR